MFFLFFEIFIFTLFMDIFRLFPISTGHNLSPMYVIFWLRERCTIRNGRLLTFFENSCFTFKGIIFPIFLQFFNITLVSSMACDLSFWAIFSNNYDGNKYISFQDLRKESVGY